MRVADCLAIVIVTRTFSSFPFAVFGTVKRRVASPVRNCSRWRISFPFTDGSQIILPVVSFAPVSLRVTLKLTSAVFPATSLAGSVVGLPITGLTTRCAVFTKGGAGVTVGAAEPVTVTWAESDAPILSPGPVVAEATTVLAKLAVTPAALQL